ncbi:MAG: hypothetical protein HGA59_02800 [Chlorobiaceae bacterium]|nr:hypothetical protein [Chlorobiaceae bacterium]NTV16352.1 hypothetical protein [Chlorobiaceae bacterium]
MSTEWAYIIDANRDVIIGQWLDCSLALFPEKMGYDTPVADALAEALGTLLTGLGKEDQRFMDALDDITRILAVQNFPPSRAISIFFEPKAMFREIMKRSNVAESLTQKVQTEFSSRIDELVLQAFDSYMQHREKIAQLKVEEGSRRMFMALRRAEA